MNSNPHNTHLQSPHSSTSHIHSPQTSHSHSPNSNHFPFPPSPDSQTPPASASSHTADNHSPTPTPSAAKNSQSDSILRYRDHYTRHSLPESPHSPHPFPPNPHRSSQSVCVRCSSVPLHQTPVRFASSPPRSQKPRHFRSLPPSPHSQFDLPVHTITTTCHPSQSSPQSPSRTGANPHIPIKPSPSVTPLPNYARSHPSPNTASRNQPNLKTIPMT